MCKFLSAVVTKSGEILCDPEHSDSHSELLEHFGLRDDELSSHLERFAKVQFVPPEDGKDVASLSKWTLTVDEATCPDWLDADKLRPRLEALVSPHILSEGERPLLLGGWWILAGKVQVGRAVNTVIKSMNDDAKVGNMSGSSKVDSMNGSSKVDSMNGSSNG